MLGLSEVTGFSEDSLFLGGAAGRISVSEYDVSAPIAGMNLLKMG